LPIGTGAEHGVRARHDPDRALAGEAQLPALVTQIEITVSIGVAASPVLQDALDRAEQACVEAKRKGRNRTSVSPQI
jgi:PleD family two-component response regulator